MPNGVKTQLWCAFNCSQQIEPFIQLHPLYEIFQSLWPTACVLAPRPSFVLSNSCCGIEVERASQRPRFGRLLRTNLHSGALIFIAADAAAVAAASWQASVISAAAARWSWQDCSNDVDQPKPMSASRTWLATCVTVHHFFRRPAGRRLHAGDASVGVLSPTRDRGSWRTTSLSNMSK